MLREWIREEAFRCQIRKVEVATGNLITTEIEFAFQARLDG
jgi:hypothetical protein